jgi:hypothetical protein
MPDFISLTLFARRVRCPRARVAAGAAHLLRNTNARRSRCARGLDRGVDGRLSHPPPRAAEERIAYDACDG